MTDPHDPPAARDERIMTRTEVASWLALSIPTLMARVREGKIPASRIGAEWRFWKPAVRSRLFPQEAPMEPHRADLEVLTTAQLAEILQFTGETVRARIEDGSIPASKTGNQWRVYWPAIRARLEAGENFTPRDEPAP